MINVSYWKRSIYICLVFYFTLKINRKNNDKIKKAFNKTFATLAGEFLAAFSQQPLHDAKQLANRI